MIEVQERADVFCWNDLAIKVVFFLQGGGDEQLCSGYQPVTIETTYVDAHGWARR